MTGVQSVKLVRGLSSLLHGPNVLGGILEMALGSGQPVDSRQLMFSSGVDADGAIAADVVGGRSITTGGGTLLVRGGGGVRDRSQVSLPSHVVDQYSGDDSRSNSAFSQKDAFGALRFSSAGGGYFGITASGYQTERGVAPELHISGPRFWKYPNQARTLGIVSLGSALARTPLGYGSVDARFGYSRGTVHIQAFEDGSYSTIGSEEHGDERLSTAHLLFTHTFPLNGTIKAALTGGKVEYEEILATSRSKFEQRLWSTALEVEIPAGNRLVLSGGLAGDASTTPRTAGREPLPRRDDIGWRVGASLGVLGERGRVHASVSERARFPALRELYSGALNRFEPNPNLSPESLLGAEVGFSLAADQVSAAAFNMQAVLFHHQLHDAVVRTNFTGTNRFIRVNRDEVVSTGLELFASYNADRVTGRGLTLSGDLLVQNVRITDQIASAARQLEHQPEFKARVEVGLPLVLQMNGFASARHTGRIYCLHPDGGALVELKAQTAFDMSFSKLLRVRSSGLLGRLKAVFGVDNVTDAAVYDQCGLPQPGRTLRLGFQLF
jgi:iron complex outermembrane receptor protein